MKHLLKIVVLGVLGIIFQVYVAYAINPPKSRDLQEDDMWQRRDLSMPGSRIVINFYDFNGKKTAAEFSNRPTLPLNVAYLSTHKNIKGCHPRTRFSRAVSDLLTIRNSVKGFDAMVKDSLEGIALSYATQWMPHALPFRAKYEGGDELGGVDFFYDNKTLVRSLDLKRGNGYYCISGKYGGTLALSNNILVVDNGNIRYAVNFNIPILNFKKTEDQWHIALDLKKKQSVVVAFADEDESENDLIKRVQAPFINGDIKNRMAENETYWNSFLSNVPRPENFELVQVKTYGILSGDLKSAYYKAWVFTAQNVLPEDDMMFPYPQVCAGKASLWDEGEERAPFSAAWESFIGIQWYAYVDPTLAWKAFKGLMTLVDKEGMLGGESLPSRKVQTARILYELTHDKESLKEVYPALKRYMNWRLNVTHWIYQDIKPSTSYKDAEFCFSALIDMEHLMVIAGELGYENDAEIWQQAHQTFSEKCLEWFWRTPQTIPEQNYDINSDSGSKGNTIWVTTGLYVDGLLKGDYLNSMMKRFDSEYDTDKSFAGFGIPKYPDVSYSVYGLLQHGYVEKAQGVIEANLRDIVRAKATFAEQYVGDDFEPDGVRPSLFGSSTLIDFVWLLNGFKYDRGIPECVLLNQKKGGVQNILIRGERYSLKINPHKREAQWGVNNGKPEKRIIGETRMEKLKIER